MDIALDYVLRLLSDYAYLVPFVGAFAGGEGALILIAMLSAQGVIPFWALMVFGYLGTIVSDSIWYWVAKTKVWHRFIAQRHVAYGYEKIAFALELIGKGRHFFVLLLTKFLIGTRIIVIMYLSREHLSFRIFTLYNSVVTLIWLSVIASVGWLAGKGFLFLVEIFNGIQVALTVFILLAAFFYFGRIWINRWLRKKQNQFS